MKTRSRMNAVLTLAALVTFSLLSTAANADVVTPVSVTGHNGGQGFGSPSGELITMIDGSGMTIGDPNDPTTWTATSNSWPNEWQSTSLLSGASNGKIAWTAFDLGSVQVGLDQLFIWNERENQARSADEINVYYSSTPTVGLPPTPGETATSADVGFGPGDYDFSSGGWTLVTNTNLTWRNTDGANPNGIISLGGVSAQYVAIEILSNGVGTTGDSNRTGLAEIGITQVLPPVPEPSTFALAALGIVGLVGTRRRRRRC
ncbi:MAG: PEP-CTERM sorting domain-containing protein [Pirellulales bacterium]|nr:PEP-CTERM sorting domain-containing protein [Pirellulales bacterium]